MDLYRHSVYSKKSIINHYLGKQCEVLIHIMAPVYIGLYESSSISLLVFGLILSDVRDLRNFQFEQAPTMLITSLPYSNHYDYTRSYCLELCFHFVRNFEELKSIRFGILRSHTESRQEEGNRRGTLYWLRF